MAPRRMTARATAGDLDELAAIARRFLPDDLDAMRRPARREHVDALLSVLRARLVDGATPPP